MSRRNRRPDRSQYPCLLFEGFVGSGFPSPELVELENPCRSGRGVGGRKSEMWLFASSCCG